MTVWYAFLSAVLLAAVVTIYWANARVWKRVLDFDPRRGWLMNPRAWLAGLRSFDFLILAAASAIGSYALRTLSLAYQAALMGTHPPS